jgi:hypothetical protein
MQSLTNHSPFGIYLGINYLSSSTLLETVASWSSFKDIKKIYIVDNYSNNLERDEVKKICRKFGVFFIESPNVGYGAALNYGLDIILKSNRGLSYVVFFGNIDVYPKKINLSSVNEDFIPVLNIEESGQNKNPFLKNLHLYFLFIPCLAARWESKAILMLWMIFKKVIDFFPGTTKAVHGSLFGLTDKQLSQLMPIFNAQVFLYCEELFFMSSVKKANFKFKKTDNDFIHIGSVSTNKTIKLDKERYFKNWVKSMRIFCDE